jgi:LysM repeat protein
VLVLAFWSLVSALGPAGASSAVVVGPGMTLTQLASEHLPEVPLSQAVTDIQRANRLSTTDIAVGQELVIPGR